MELCPQLGKRQSVNVNEYCFLENNRMKMRNREFGRKERKRPSD